MRDATRMLVGGAIVYVIMAACSSTNGVGAHQAGGANGSGGAGIAEVGTDGSAQFLDATSQMIDAVVSPVPEAAAAVTPPTMATETCSKQSLSSGPGGVSYIYAVHSFPGKTKADLSALRIVAHLPFLEPVLLPGYEDATSLPVLVKDGEAAVHCGTVNQTTTTIDYDSVTFILPAS